MDIVGNLSVNLNTSQKENGTSAERANWWTIFLISILILTILIPNVLVIISFIVEPRLRTPFNYYLLSMAVSDFLVGARPGPSSVSSQLHRLRLLALQRRTMWLLDVCRHGGSLRHFGALGRTVAGPIVGSQSAHLLPSV